MLPKRPNKIKIALLLGTLTFATFKSAYANVPIGGAMVMALPFVSLLSSWGLALVVAVLIEILVLKQRLDLKYFEAGKLSLYANIFSTLIGVGIGIAYSSSIAFLVCWIPGSIFLLKCFNSLSDKTGFLKHFTKIKILRIIPFLAMGIIGLFFGTFLTPEIYRSPQSQASNQFIKLISFVVLLALGFVITFLTEGYIIARRHLQKSDKIISAVILMNLISYTVLMAFFVLYI